MAHAAKTWGRMRSPMNTKNSDRPSIQPEDYLAILRGVVIINWCAVGLAVVLELVLRGMPDYVWPHWGNFTWTYNLVLAEFLIVTLGLSMMLRDTAWLDRAPREALARLRMLLMAVLLLDGLHFLGFFQLTGALRGPMMMVLPVVLMALYLCLPRRDAHLLCGALLLGTLLVLVMQASGVLPARGLLASAFDGAETHAVPFALVAIVALLAALLIGGAAGRRMEQAGINLLRGVSHDPVTYLFTREMLERRVPGELARIGRSESSAALMMIEFKNMSELLPQANFEAFRDIVGQFAAVLRTVTRDGSDTCAQYDVNTFAALLPTATADSALQIANRIQQGADAIQSTAGEHASVQLAIGVAIANVAGKTSAADFIAAAREALAEAWQAGTGHQVVLRAT